MNTTHDIVDAVDDMPASELFYQLETMMHFKTEFLNNLRERPATRRAIRALIKELRNDAYLLAISESLSAD